MAIDRSPLRSVLGDNSADRSPRGQGILNNQAFSHASSISRFQPFVRSKTTYVLEEDAELMGAGDQKTNDCSSSKSSKDEDKRVIEPKVHNSSNSQIVE
ncbi:hypothetical protein QN277_009747 [Acacia crassicarpa]|uniref:Uncharacterized protein n=1 Tax=Acacia crassicarpa TaxID=499986 RepID=A0AAE1MC58_9FABA|nr:hypothetical protein QN277_009747 [Acacia crassicarpa]